MKKVDYKFTGINKEIIDYLKTHPINECTKSQMIKPGGLRKSSIQYNWLKDKLKSLEEKGIIFSKTVKDPKRIKYYAEHIRQLYLAVTQGVPVEKYFLWTLMDNYEWAEGYRPQSCFGIIHVDRKTFKRVWKESARWYKKLVKTKTLELG